MPREALLQALQQRPFQPFRLYVSDGAVYVVRHPDVVLVAPGYVIVGQAPPAATPGLIERHDVVSLGHITRLEPLEATAAAGGNGQ